MKKASNFKLLTSTTRTADDLFALLDGPIIKDTQGKPLLPKCKPLTPSQTDRLVTKAFMAILDQLHLLRLELLNKHSNINEIRAASIQILETEKDRKKGVVNPKTITLARSVQIFDKRLKFIETLFSEVLQLYERQTGKSYNPGGTVK